MLNSLYRIYFYRYKYGFVERLFLRLVVRLCNVILPVYFLITRFLPQNRLASNGKNETDERFIVSLTSFPARIDRLWLTIETIIRQKEKPDRLILWLYKDEFNGLKSLPKRLLEQQSRGLEIRFCDQNIKPHKKYFYVMQEYPHANIITIDDDMFYPSNLIQKLKYSHRLYPDAICCAITRRITLKDNALSSYNSWPYLRSNTPPSYANLTMGGGGTLFPKKSLDPEAFKMDELMNFAPTTDDLWLKVMSLKNKVKVASIAGEFSRFFLPVLQKNQIRLMDENVLQSKNDEVMSNLVHQYGINIEQIRD